MVQACVRLGCMARSDVCDLGVVDGACLTKVVRREMSGSTGGTYLALRIASASHDTATDG